VFSFLGWRLETIQVLLHCCLPFPKIIGQVINFYKSKWAKLVDTIKKLHIFFFGVTYWQVFKKSWPKQKPLKLSCKFEVSQHITNLKALVMPFKFEPSYLTQTIICFLKPYWFNSLVKFLANACHVVFNDLNNPIVIFYFPIIS